MRTYQALGSALLVTILAPSAVAEAPEAERIRTTVLGLSSMDRHGPRGHYVVELRAGGAWKQVAKIGGDKYLRQQVVDLDEALPAGPGDVTLRVVKRGGGAGHLDFVSLGGERPRAVVGAGANGEVKLASSDLDVVDAGSAIELTFPAPRDDRTLRLTGRIEGKRITETPFRFPGGIGGSVGAGMPFYQYRLGSRPGTLTVDGKLDEVENEKPLFRDYTAPGTGHPSDYTYGWVSNDDENLYVAIDFTSDNTLDGQKDYAAVHVTTPEGPKTFRVSMTERRWGQPGFVYTSRVGYQHKTYELKIPLSEIGVGAASTEPLKLTFDAYGTSAPGRQHPALAFDPVNARFFLTYYEELMPSGKDVIQGQLVATDGTPSGAVFEVGDSGRNVNHPDVAFEPTSARYLVVWHAFGPEEVHAQLLDADGMVVGGGPTTSPIIISNSAPTKNDVRVEADPATGRFLVAWRESGSPGNDVMGQLVNSDGTLMGNNFMIADGQLFGQRLDLTVDPINGRFLSVFDDQRGGLNLVFGQFIAPDGTLPFTDAATNFTVSTATGDKAAPAVSFDSANQRFLVSFEDFRNASRDVYGQLRTNDGSSFGSAPDMNFPVSDEAVSDQRTPMSAYDNIAGNHVVVWRDERNSPDETFMQRIGTDGTPVGPATNMNSLVTGTSDTTSAPAIAVDTICGNVLIATELGSPGDIALSLLPGPGCPEIVVTDTVAPADDLTVDFGDVNVGDSVELLVTVENTGGAPLVVGPVAGADALAAPFSLTNDGCTGQSVAGAAQCTFGVTFNPTAAGAATDTLDIPSNDADENPVVVTVNGNGVEPDAGVDAGVDAAAGTGGMAGAPGGQGGMPAGSGGQGASGGAVGVDDAGPSKPKKKKEEGCNCRTAGSPGSSRLGVLSLLLLAAAGLRRRQRRG